MSFQEGEEGEVELEIEDEATLEHTLLIVREVAVYKIPPRSTSGGYKCGEWLQSDKIWAGRLRVVSCKARCEIRLEDPGSGDLFTACFVQPDQPREAAVETVLDPSRYFVLRIEDGRGKHAFVGLGFAERNEAFDFNVALLDHKKHVRREQVKDTGESTDDTHIDIHPAINHRLKNVWELMNGQLRLMEVARVEAKEAVDLLRDLGIPLLIAEKPLEGFHIVVDAGNGAGGFFTAKVLEPLGAVTTGSQFLEPEGLFPNHIPNPEDKTAMKAITQTVLDNKADLGIIFDTDVDRSAAVDSTGREFNRNRLIALMSAIVLEEHPRTTIVTDSVTSDGLTTFIEKKLGGKHHRFKRGYKNVIDEAIRLNSIGEESHLAIETSGHGALRENHWLDDGAYLMVKILNKLASARASGMGGGSKVLTDLVEGLQEAAVAVELRLKINQNHPDLKGGYWSGKI